MQKIITLILTIVCVLGTVGCSSLDNVPTIEFVKKYTSKDFNEHLKGVNREGLIKVWGEPTISLTEEKADMWDIDDERMVFIFWKDNSKFKYADIRPIVYHGEYIDDSKLLIIHNISEVESNEIVKYYENAGIILVTNWVLAEQVQSLLSPTVTSSFSASDVAVLFYKTESGAPGVSIAGGNSSDWDAEIDEMIRTAKEKTETVNSIAIAVQGMLEAAEEEASALHKKLTEDPSLKQSDMNELSHEIYQIWDDLLNELWAIMKDTLDEKTMHNLLEEQREWITMKEAEAKKTGEAFSGGSMAPFASNQKAAELTKERVYELADYLGF